MFMHYLSKGFKMWLGKRPELPSYLIFFVTSRCNAKCQHCFFWKNLNTSSKELSLKEIENLSLSLKRVSNLSISGGEPFLREDLPEICEVFYKNNGVKKIHIPTNGLIPEKIKSVMEEILKKCDCSVNLSLSLDGLEKTHDSIRGVKGCFSSLLKTYEKVVMLKEKYPHLRVSVNTVVSNQNYRKIRNLVSFVKEHMPKINGHGFDLVRGYTKNKDLTLPPLDEIKSLIPFLNETRRYYLRNRKGLVARLELCVRYYISDLKFKILKEQKQVIPCRAGDFFAIIYPEGDIALCELLPVIGNLRKGGIRAVWNSKKAEEQRECIKERKCYCTHGCFQPSNVIYYPPAYPKLLWYFIKG